MKKIIIIFFLVFLCRYVSFAQGGDSLTYIYISDTTALSYVASLGSEVEPVFTDAAINSLLSSYTFTIFQQAYPTSRYKYLRSFYEVKASSSSFAAALCNSYPYLFPQYKVKTPAVINADNYYPNDFWDNVHTSTYNDNLVNTYTWYLDYIHAPEAWYITKGSPSTVIGVTDNGFFVNGAAGTEGNPDLTSKVLVLEDNIGFPAADEPAHGTMVAGLIAAASDNAAGYPSIGFNCMLDLDMSSDQENLFLSGTQGRRVINASWWDSFLGESDTVDWSGEAGLQLLYNEIYENGTSMCFSAGNTTSTPWGYQYPSSLNHILSVTNVMGEGCPWVNGTGVCGEPCNCDQHDITTGDTSGATTEFHHNLRVDLCAPAVRVGGLTYNPDSAVGNPSRYYQHDAGWGTSFASPLVAGTVGLMLSENPALSPYQVEWILKQSSRDIYDSSVNNYLYNIDRFHSRAGAGALDAGAAVMMCYSASSTYLLPNDSTTQTLMVDGIEFNTICVPGRASNGAIPQLRPIVENGTPPYTYQWAPLVDNRATLSSDTAANPTIIAADTPFLAHFLLTVYDNSQIQKVADKEIKIQLQSKNTYTLGMRDSYMDMMDQPNSQAVVNSDDWNIWLSPDIWNRQNPDGDTIPQNIAYDDSSENYMYVRVRNIGCANYPGAPARLHKYWTLGSTGESWEVDWTTAEVLGADSTLKHAGGEVTVSAGIAIPSLNPGDQYISGTGWYPQNPEEYASHPPAVEQCALARITVSGEANMGMNVPEVTNVSTNVRNNIAIVTRNMTDVELAPRIRYTGPVKTQIYVANPISTQKFSLQFITDKDVFKQLAGNLSENMYVVLQLQPALYSAWQSGGSRGKYTSTNANQYTITYNPNIPLQLDSITIDSGAKYYVNVEFFMNGNPAAMPANQMINFRQLTSVGQLLGDYSFNIHVAADTPRTKGVLAVTEIANAPGNCQYAEMVVANCGSDTSSTVDITGWIIDDNSGNFNTGGCMSGAGINSGHYRFPNSYLWKNVPVGSIIVVFNHDNDCYNIADTFITDTVSGLVRYWIPIGGTVTSPYGSPNLEAFALNPTDSECVYNNDTAINIYTTAYGWSSLIRLDSSGDAFQVRCPMGNLSEPAFYHGIGYGPSTGNDAFASISAGTNNLGGAVVPGAGTNSKYVFSGSSAKDLGTSTQWLVSTANTAGSIPSTLGNVNSTFMSAVKGHTLDLPCCSNSGDERRTHMGNTASTNGQQQAMVNQISVFPNPANSTLNFSFPLTAKTTIRLLNISGQLVAQQTIYDATSSTMDVSAYAPGLYLYQVTTSGQAQSGKIVIGH